MYHTFTIPTDVVLYVEFLNRGNEREERINVLSNVTKLEGGSANSDQKVFFYLSSFYFVLK